jgi:ribosome-binding protein aMBF1 (putative translation factor)
MARTKNFADVIRAKLAADPTLGEAVERELLNAEIAAQVREARERASLTQKQLAQRVGTQQPVISRIEDADYDGHSLNLLKRIARVLNVRLHVKFERAQCTNGVRASETYQLNWCPEWQLQIHSSLKMAR